MCLEPLEITLGLQVRVALDVRKQPAERAREDVLGLGLLIG